MTNIIIIAVLMVILGSAARYIYKAKKSGAKCIGCPSGCICGSPSRCNGDVSTCSCCGCHTDEE